MEYIKKTPRNQLSFFLTALEDFIAKKFILLLRQTTVNDNKKLILNPTISKMMICLIVSNDTIINKTNEIPPVTSLAPSGF